MMPPPGPCCRRAFAAWPQSAVRVAQVVSVVAVAGPARGARLSPTTHSAHPCNAKEQASMHRLLMGAWWGVRACDPATAMEDLRRWTRLIAELPGGVPGWALRRDAWEAPERVALAGGEWQLPHDAVARFQRDEETGAADPGFGVSVSLIEAGWTAAAGRSRDDLHAATLTATLGSTRPSTANSVVLQVCAETLPGPALWQPCFDALVLDFLPEHAAVVDWTRPDPQDTRPPWGRDPESLAQYPPRQQALGCATEREAAALARLQAAARRFDTVLAQAAARGDRACAEHRAEIAALIAAVARGDVKPPAEKLYRGHWHSEDPVHGRGTTVFSGQATFLSALEDWPSKPWYPSARDGTSVEAMPLCDASGAPRALSALQGLPRAWGHLVSGWRGWFRRR
jgi:hypothetical protein